MASARHWMGMLFPAALAAAALGCASTSYWSEPSTYTGPELFETFCASCHGVKGHGDGPVAPILKVPVPDLTHIAARNGGTFPTEQVYRMIDGQADNSSHGPRHMPVWGYEFFGDDSDDKAAHAQAERTIDRLVRYLESIQRSEWAR